MGLGSIKFFIIYFTLYVLYVLNFTPAAFLVPDLFNHFFREFSFADIAAFI